MERGETPFSLDRQGYHIHWDAVPAWICQQCGEPYFEAREIEIMQGAAKSVEEQNQRWLQAS